MTETSRSTLLANGCRYGLALMPMSEWTEQELRVTLAEDEGEYQRWNTARRIREEMAERGLEAPPQTRGPRWSS